MKRCVSLLIITLIYVLQMCPAYAGAVKLYDYNGEIYGLHLSQESGVMLDGLSMVFDLEGQYELRSEYKIHVDKTGFYQLLLPYSVPSQTSPIKAERPEVVLEGQKLKGEWIALGHYEDDKNRQEGQADKKVLNEKIEDAFRGDYTLLENVKAEDQTNIGGTLYTLYLHEGEERLIEVTQKLFPQSTAEITDKWTDYYRVTLFDFSETNAPAYSMRIEVIPNWDYEFGKPYLVDSNLPFEREEAVYYFESPSFDESDFYFAMYSEEELVYTRLNDEGQPVSKTEDQTLMWLVTLLVIGIFLVLLLAMTLFIVVVIAKRLFKSFKAYQGKKNKTKN